MINKLNSKYLALLTLIYTAAAALCLTTAMQQKIVLIFWIPSGIAIASAIIYGARTMVSLIVSALILVVVNIIFKNSIHPSSLNLGGILFSDILLAYIFAKYYKHKIPILDYIDDLKKYLSLATIATFTQSLFLFTFFLSFNRANINSIAETLQLIISSFFAPSIIIAPYVLSFYTKPKNTDEKSHLTKLLILIATIILFSIFDLTRVTGNKELAPIQFLIIVSTLFYAVQLKHRQNTLFVLFLSILLIGNSALNLNFLSSFISPYNIINAQHIVVFIGLISLIVNAILNERNNAISSLNNSYTSIKNEVDQQTEMLKSLNNKLISEIEQKGIIEKELNLSKKLLTESQEIANITSWEYILKSKTIRWSESAARILGISASQVSAFSMERYIDNIHPDDKRHFLNAISKASEKTKDINLQLRYSLNNRYRHFLIKGRSFNENDEIERIVGVLSDITDWKEAQLALSEKEIRYRALFNTNLDAVVLIDGETKSIIDVNSAFEKMYGYTKDEVMGTPFINLSAQETETHQAIEIAVQRGLYSIPNRLHRRKNGEEFYVEGYLVKFMSNEKTQLFAVIRDISLRKKFETELAQREHKFRLFFESNLIGMAETTIYKSWISFNTKLCQILGYKPEELEKLTWDKITHPNDIDFEIKQFNNILQRKNDSYTLEKRFIKKDGSTVFCNVSVKAIKDNSGKITHLVKLIEDITLRKKAENAVFESQNRLKKAQEIAHLGVCRLNTFSEYLEISEQAFEILEWNRENAPFKLETFIQSIHPIDREIVSTSINKVKSGEIEEENLNIRMVKPSGDFAYLSLNLGIALDTNKKVGDLIVTFADVTASKLAEEALKEANAMKDQLFSVISHDLRGPIGSVEQLLSLYLSSPEGMDNESKSEIITLVHNTTKESYNLLENLLEWGRSQRQATIKPTLVEIRNVVSETVQLLSSMASAKNINIESDIDLDSKAFVDLMMLKTIIRNLISNAIKFTPNGGIITINSHSDNKICTIEVSDTGVGIPIDRIELIFDDAKVFSTSGTNSEKGTGLGLKLVKRFVDKNSGTIQVHSNQGQGTTFSIKLPAQELDSAN